MPKVLLLLLTVLGLLCGQVARASQFPRSVGLAARSRLLRSNLLVALPAALMIVAPGPARAAKGAFEMDAEYYLRNLRGGGKGSSGGSGEAPKGNVFLPTPRKIDAVFAEGVVQSAIALLGPGFNRQRLTETVAAKLPAFRKTAPIVVENFSDQYYFDVVLYCVYEQAKELLPSSQQRVAFRSSLGSQILSLVLARPGAAKSIPIPTTTTTTLPQEQIATGVAGILGVLQDCGQIKGYVFDADDFGDADFAARSFSAGLPVSTSIQLLEPCTVLSFIQAVRDDTFFHPEIVGTTLVEYMGRCGLGARFEDYLLDNYYRTSTFDVQAQDIVLELQVSSDRRFALGL